MNVSFFHKNLTDSKITVTIPVLQNKAEGSATLTSRFFRRGQYQQTVLLFYDVSRVPFALVFLFMEVFLIASTDYEINEEIRDRELRLIAENGEQLGIMSADEALKIAHEVGLDLVKIAPQANPPVCKLIDYGKFRFEQSKREKEARKKQHIVEVKEIRMSPKIGDHDVNVKLRNGRRFLENGDRLKVTVRFRGREMAHTQIGEELLINFAENCSDIASLDANPKLDGRFMSIFLSPLSSAALKKKKSQEEKEEKEGNEA